MAEHNHDAHQPEVGQVGEQDEEAGEDVVEGVFVVVSLRPDEHVHEGASHVLPELNHVDHFHGRVCFWEPLRHEVVVVVCEWRPRAPQPGREEGRVLQDPDAGDGGQQVEHHRIAPLHQSVGPFGSGLALVALLGEHVFEAPVVEQVVDEQIEALGYWICTMNARAKGRAKMSRS